MDIVDSVKPVRKNENDIVILCNYEECQGYIGSDNETVFARLGKQLQPQFTDVALVVMASEEIPEEVEPLTYKFIDGEFVENEDDYPLDNTALTREAAKISADVEYIAVMVDVEL